MTEEELNILKQGLRRVQRILGWELDAQSECCGVTFAQRAVIAELGLKGETSLVNLAKALGLDTSTLSRTIQGLVNIGLVRRDIDSDDRRYVTLKLTARGRNVFQMIEDLSTAYFRKVFGLIPGNKRKDVLENLSLFVDALNRTKIIRAAPGAECRVKEEHRAVRRS